MVVFGHVLLFMHIMAICELNVKILITPRDSATPSLSFNKTVSHSKSIVHALVFWLVDPERSIIATKVVLVVISFQEMPTASLIHNCS